jgi:hypothetical protein
MRRSNGLTRAVMSSFTSLGAALSGLDDQTQLNPQSRPVQEARRAAQIALDRNPDSYEFLRRLLETNRVTDPTVLQYILGRTGMTLVAWDDDLNQGYLRRMRNRETLRAAAGVLRSVSRTRSSMRI